MQSLAVILGLSVVLDAGANGNARDYSSDTLLTTAISRGHVVILATLLAAGY